MDDSKGRRCSRSTVTACAFIAVSNKPLPAPKATSTNSKDPMPGACGMAVSATPMQTAPTRQARALPARPIHRPAGPIAAIAPKATASIAPVKVSGDSEKRPATCGM